MTVFAVTYLYDDRTYRRDEVRPEHRAFLATLHGNALLASGPFTDDDAAGALLIVTADSRDAAAALLDADPFAREGLITSRTIRPWTQIYGPWTPPTPTT